MALLRTCIFSSKILRAEPKRTQDLATVSITVIRISWSTRTGDGIEPEWPIRLKFFNRKGPARYSALPDTTSPLPGVHKIIVEPRRVIERVKFTFRVRSFQIQTAPIHEMVHAIGYAQNHGADADM